jgi:alpha-tubulin suppressor-like RCC1 family protein
MFTTRISDIDRHSNPKSDHTGGIFMKGKRFISVLTCAVLLSSLSYTAQAAVPIINIPVSTGGSGHSLAVMNDGTLWGWGYNYQHQLGGAANDNLATPVQIMDDAVAGSMHSLAVKSDGSLFGWGSNTYGQLGVSQDGQEYQTNGSVKEYYSATPVKIMDGAASVAANGTYSYVIKNDGTLWAFGGDEKSGERLIGDGTVSQPAPVKVMDNVVLVSAGGSNVLALKEDGSLFMWGDNASGEIGDGTTTAHARPVKVMEDVVAAAQGTFHTLAVKKDGSLWAWGSNYGGGLGDGTNEDSLVPVKIMEDVVSVAAGTCHSLAVKKDGSLWSWGQGVRGFEGKKGYNYTPEKILEDVVHVSAKQHTNYAVKADGSLWAWGDGMNLGNIYSPPFPREIMNQVMTPSQVNLPVAPSITTEAVTVQFSDVLPDAWYYDAVSFCAAKGITTGTGNGKFSPDATLTRGQFITMLLKAYGIEPVAAPADNFDDGGDTYYTGYLAAAKAMGISNGVGDNIFAPEKAVTRQEMFTMLYNTLKAVGQLPPGDSGKMLSDFSDANSVADWAAEAMTALVKSGTISGSNGKLDPTGISTRAQMAQVLYNLLGK